MQKKRTQVRESLEKSGMKLIEKRDDECILLEESGCTSIWTENDRYAGYVVVIEGKGYEYVSYSQS